MPVNPSGYPLDLTGLAPSNFITNEVHLLTTPRDRLFVPSAGPFFHIGSQIRNGVTNQILLPNTDYKLLHLHKPAAIATGANIYTVVYIINETIPHVIMDYHVVGGIHGETADVIRTLLESFPLPNDGDSVSWGQIIGVPVQFTPAEHLHHIDEIYNFNDVVSVLEQIRIAILAGDGAAINAIYQYFHQYLVNADYATHNDLESVTSAVPFFEIKTFPDYATMRQATTMINDAPAVYACLGRDNMFDGNGRLFVWDIAANVADDNDFTVRPNHIPAINNGRFLAFQRNEKDLNRLALSLQRKINFDGSVDDAVYETGNVVVGNCDNYLHMGTYWVGDHTLITNAPFSWCVLKVDNISVDASGTLGEVCQTFYNGTGDKATRFRYYDAGTTSFVWTVLTYYARREGDATIYFNVKDAVGYDHAVNLRQLTSYGGNVNVQFLVSDATLPDHAVTLRQVLNNEMDCHLGIVIRYFGNTSILLPCYIGESGGHGNLVTVYISNSLRLVNLADIQPLYVGATDDGIGLFSDNYFGHIYLVRNPANGTYRLRSTSIAPEMSISGNMTNKRKRLRASTTISIAGPDIEPEDTVYLGCAYKRYIGSGSGAYHWWLCRSWFQDPGMIEHHGLYNCERDNITTLPKISGPLSRIDFDDDNYCSNGGLFYSPYYDKSISEIQVMLWAGEKIVIGLNAMTAMDHPSAVMRSVVPRIALYKWVSQVGPTDYVYRADLGKLGSKEVNAHANNLWDQLCFTDEFIAPETGRYSLSLTGVTNNSDTKFYLQGHHYLGTSKSNLRIAVDQYHSYRQLVVSAINPATETLTISYQNTTVFNTDIYQMFLATYGQITDHPFLTEIVVEIGLGSLIGSTTTGSAALFIDDSIPAGINVTINLRYNSFIVGKGGKGGDNFGTRNGEDGGDAIRAERSFTINVEGTLGGAGGGGAGGTDGTSGATGSDGGPGGGGAGNQPGVAGDRHRTSPLSGDEVAAYPGTDGATTTGGVGGLAVTGGPRNGNFSQGAHGGPGGNLGQPGGVAFNGIALVGSSGTPGAAGRAVRLYNGASVTVNVNGGTVAGAY